MSVSNIQSEIQSAEQYKIRKQTEAKQGEELQAQQIQPVQEVHKTDEYDKANPVGEQAEGIYSVSHDDEGNLKVNYVQPGEKSEKAGVSNGGAAPAAASKAESEDDDSDSETDAELEELKKQRDALKLKMNSAVDEDTKAALRAQLQSVEMQIAMINSNKN